MLEFQAGKPISADFLIKNLRGDYSTKNLDEFSLDVLINFSLNNYINQLL